MQTDVGRVARASLVLALATCSFGGAAAPGRHASSSQLPRTIRAPGPNTNGVLVIHGTDDVSLDPSHIPSFRTHGYGWAWSGLRGLFQRDDLTVVNLECPATDVVDPAPKAFTIRCD